MFTSVTVDVYIFVNAITTSACSISTRTDGEPSLNETAPMMYRPPQQSTLLMSWKRRYSRPQPNFQISQFF